MSKRPKSTSQTPARGFPAWILWLSLVGAAGAILYAVSSPDRTAQAPSAPATPPPQPAMSVPDPPPGADFGQWVAVGNQRMDAQQFDDAIRLYSRALELDSTAADVWVDRGACRHAQGDDDGAIADFRAALRLRPTHIVAHFNMGIAHLTAGRPDSARSWWQRLLLLDSTGREAERARQLIAFVDSVQSAQRGTGP